MSDTDKSLALEVSPLGLSLYSCEGDAPVECLAHVAKDAPDFREQTVRFSRKAQPDWGYHPKTELWFTEDEVLLRHVKLSGRTAAQRRRNAAQQLSAMTPFEGSELAFDLGAEDTDGYTPIAAIPAKKAQDAMALARSIGMVPTAVTMSDEVTGFDTRPRLMPVADAPRRLSRPLQAATLVALLALPVLLFSGGMDRMGATAPGIGGEFLAAVLPSSDPGDAAPLTLEKDPVSALFDLPGAVMTAPNIGAAPQIDETGGNQATDLNMRPETPDAADRAAATVTPTQVMLDPIKTLEDADKTTILLGGAEQDAPVAGAGPQGLILPVSVDALPRETDTESAAEQAINTSMVLYDLQAAFTAPERAARPAARRAIPRRSGAIAVAARPGIRPEIQPATARLDFDVLNGFSKARPRAGIAPTLPRLSGALPRALIRPDNLAFALAPDIRASIKLFHEKRQAVATARARQLAGRPGAFVPPPPQRDVMPGPGGAGALVQISPPGTIAELQDDVSKAPMAPVSLFAQPQRHNAPLVIAALTADVAEILATAAADRARRAAKAAELAALQISDPVSAPRARPAQAGGLAPGAGTDVAAAPSARAALDPSPTPLPPPPADAAPPRAGQNPLLLASIAAPKPRGTPRASAPAAPQVAAAAVIPDGEAALAPLRRPRDLGQKAAQIRKRNSEVDAIVARNQKPRASVPASNLRLPTSVRVSRTATISDGINLGDISLIGIFGKSNARMALIRTPSGRIHRVKRGARVDGWMISAISEKNVRIQRRSKTVTLRLPN